jgi:capsular polysaccharide biosynthesis protein
MTQLQASRLSLLLGGNLLPSAEIKVLDAPRVEAGILWTIVLYTLSVVLGLIVGLVVVYMMVYLDRTPRSAEDVEALIGAPVLVRLPRAT